MALSRYKFGELLELITIKNIDEKYGIEDAIGVNISKIILPMRGDNSDKDLSNFSLVPPNHFAYNPRGSRKLGLGFNDSQKTYIITFNNNVFKVKNSASSIILNEYLFMYMSRKEFDRKAEYISWGSSTEVFDWNVFIEEEIVLPSIKVQQKVVDVYLAMVANQKVYEKGLDDLKLTCDAYIEDLKHRNNLYELGNFLEEVTTQNFENRFKLKDVFGVSKNKEIIPTKANSSDNDLSKFTVIEKNDFVYNPRSANAIAINSSLSGGIISWNNTAFRVKKASHFALLPKYLNLWFSRDEYSRWAKFNSWGSSTELLSLDEIKKYKIPIPELNIQEAIVEVYEAYEMRKKINDNLKKQINEICPVLIKGSIDLNK